MRNEKENKEMEQELKAGQIWGDDHGPIHRIVRVNEKTVTIELWAPIQQKWFEPRQRDRYIEIGKFKNNMRVFEERLLTLEDAYKEYEGLMESEDRALMMDGSGDCGDIIARGTQRSVDKLAAKYGYEYEEFMAAINELEGEIEWGDGSEPTIANIEEMMANHDA